MGSIVTLSRTISSIADMRITLSGAQAVRQFGMGNTWTKIRIGFRLAVNPNGVTSDLQFPEIWMGICSGTSNTPAAATCANFIGYSWNVTGGIAINVTYNAGSPPYYVGGNRWDGVVYRGTTRTVVAGNNGSFIAVADPTTNRSLFFLEVWKGATYSMQMFGPSNATGAQTDVSKTTFQRLLGCGSQALSLSNYGYSGQTTGITMDESTGNLDTMVFWWPLVQRTLEISDFGYQVLVP